MANRRYLGINVLEAARDRIRVVFDAFPRVIVAFSGGKDSTVMFHLAVDEARRVGRRFAAVFIDLEGQYKLTIDHVRCCLEDAADVADPYWVVAPMNLRNAVSQFEPQWRCWDPNREADWIRRRPPEGLDGSDWEWFRPGMEFEEFVPEFGRWYAGEQACCQLVGIRTQESLNRWRTIASRRKGRFKNLAWTTFNGGTTWSAYPIYDWFTEDIWTYHARHPDRPYNELYDRMQLAGLSIHQQRICQPYGDDQRKGLWLFHLIEPETWARVVARVNGANQGALYAKEKGNILGRIKIDKPQGHSWETFAKFLLNSMPKATAEHYRNKIAIFLKWWADKGYQPIPDEAPSAQEATRKVPSWRRVCKVLLRNDYWCKGLSFSQTKPEAYRRYLRIMAAKRRQWKIL